MASTEEIAGAAHIQPTFHPVSEKILPAEPILTVRARIPGCAISERWCRPSNTTCSHTSSQIAIASWLTQKSASNASSSGAIIVPVGLSGELSSTNRVRSLATAANADSAPVAAKPAPKPTPKPVQVASATPKPAAAAPVAAASGAASVQIGALSSPALADKAWIEATRLAPGLAAGKGKKVEAVDKNGTTLYRTSVTGFASREAAKAFCEAIAASGKSCFVK